MKKVNGELPSISIVSTMYNPNKAVFKRVLEAIKNQDYPKNKIEHLLIDMGSNKDIISFAKKYGCRVIDKRDVLSAEARKSIGLQEAKNDLVLFLNLDNIMMDNRYLRRLAEPFLKEKNIVASFPLHFHYRKKMSLVDRYCALFGVADPVVLYLKKNDRQPWYVDDLKLGKTIKKTSQYSVIEFDESTLPTVGDNGYLVDRKTLLMSPNQNERYIHIDVFVDLLKQGYNKFAVIKTPTIEHHVDDSLISLVGRRAFYAYGLSSQKYTTKRRYLTFNPSSPRDVKNIFLFALFTVTIIQPLLLSIKGYLKIRDIAWFLHPIACVVFLVYYTETYLRLVSENLIQKLK